MIYRHFDGAGSWYTSSWKTRPPLAYAINGIALNIPGFGSKAIFTHSILPWWNDTMFFSILMGKCPIVSIGKGSTKYLSQLKSYSSGENTARSLQIFNFSTFVFYRHSIFDSFIFHRCGNQQLPDTFISWSMNPSGPILPWNIDAKLPYFGKDIQTRLSNWSQAVIARPKTKFENSH